MNPGPHTYKVGTLPMRYRVSAKLPSLALNLLCRLGSKELLLLLHQLLCPHTQPPMCFSSKNPLWMFWGTGDKKKKGPGCKQVVPWWRFLPYRG